MKKSMLQFQINTWNRYEAIRTPILFTIPLAFVMSCGGGNKLTTKFVAPPSTQSSNARLAAGDVGHNTVAELISLQFYVTRIQLCEGLTVSGSGYTGMTNCTTVFGESNADNAYETFKIAQASEDTSGSWIDVVNPKASKSVDITAGTYNYGVVETRKPIKLNAKLTLPNGSVTLKTCSGGSVSQVGSGLDIKEILTLSSIINCTQSLIAMGSPGGGQWFKFQKPVTLESGKAYSLDLAFNPDGVVRGSAVDSTTDSTYKDGTYSIFPPFISLVPVIRESDTQKTIREQYELSGMSGINGKIVVDLYYAGTSSDVGTGTIVGAGARFINDANATAVTTVYNPYAVTTNANGSITVKDHDGNSIVDGLTRSTSATAGSAGSASVSHAALLVGATGTLSTTVTFKGLTEM